MTMGRRGGISGVHVLVVGALLLVALVAVVAYTALARQPVRFGQAPAATSTVRRALSSLALDATEIQGILQTAQPLTAKSVRNTCGIPEALECFEAAYTDGGVDFFDLTLARFPNPEGAVNFGIRMKFQEEEAHATGLDVPITPANFQWLESSLSDGKPVYYGGANEESLAVSILWQPSTAITDDVAIGTFSRLLDAQISKIRAGP